MSISLALLLAIVLTIAIGFYLMRRSGYREAQAELAQASLANTDQMELELNKSVSVADTEKSLQDGKF